MEFSLEQLRKSDKDFAELSTREAEAAFEQMKLLAELMFDVWSKDRGVPSDSHLVDEYGRT